MSKYIYDENHTRFDIEDAFTITKGIWNDGNPQSEARLGRFVAAVNEGFEVAIAGSDSYVCGVTISNDAFLGEDNDSQHCVVQSLGVCSIEDYGTLVAGDKCMPDTDGKAVKSSNNLGYRVVGRIDSTHVQIIIAPNNDMVQRIKNDISGKQNVISDLDTIRDGAALGATSIQSHQDISGKADKSSLGTQVTYSLSGTTLTITTKIGEL